MNGAIKNVSLERGFGFIRGDDGSEYFFHRSELQAWLRFEDLKPGVRVEFATRQSDKGPRAAEIRPAAA